VSQAVPALAVGVSARLPGCPTAARLPAAITCAFISCLTNAADAAVVSCGGRTHGCWKGENQDAFALTTAADNTLLLGVFDGHGNCGKRASQAAAEGLAAAIPALLSGSVSSSEGGNGSSGNGSHSDTSGSSNGDRGSSSSNGSSSLFPVPAAQQALVAAFQEVGRSMQQSPAFVHCGAAAVVCLVQPDRSVCACQAMGAG